MASIQGRQRGVVRNGVEVSPESSMLNVECGSHVHQPNCVSTFEAVSVKLLKYKM